MDDDTRNLLKFAATRALTLNPVTAPYAAVISTVGSMVLNRVGNDDEPSDAEKIKSYEALVAQLLEENFNLKRKHGEI